MPGCEVSRPYNLLIYSLLPLSDELVHEKEKFKAISDELDQTFAEMSGYWKLHKNRSNVLTNHFTLHFFVYFCSPLLHTICKLTKQTNIVTSKCQQTNYNWSRLTLNVFILHFFHCPPLQAWWLESYPPSLWPPTPSCRYLFIIICTDPMYVAVYDCWNF